MRDISTHNINLANYSTYIEEMFYRKKFILYKNGTYNTMYHDNIYANSLLIRTIEERSDYICKGNIKYCSSHGGRYY